MIRSLVLAAAAVALSGCALLSSPDPVQLYRFGESGGTTASAVTVATPVQVRLRNVEFPAASRGDRILGTTGQEAAYIAGARWVSPAQQLMSQSIESAFGDQARTVRLIGQRELTPATRVLDIDVRTFEARYDYAGAVPVVTISARARLLRFPERTVVAEEVISVSESAGENRVSAIAQAFDLASREFNTRLVTWTEANAG
ncbi:ABC-type transport auxiliary lipoprotein family protein [Brevundimonas bacteroides]|uniref:ABC-type transport auxiliary lipoprotein family protein n=1 Tax=Brevundimonas bacteroides TaxID=74311 RepID=UPI000495E019|nr:ABC-type transport auxiliary lipoprotein family protein [Brevundimonas bacteroides]